ncbi:MAG: hypothetical protein A2Z20_08400 [Bdellovibrionales bacterium RBG_16_40_8]|nr:MAG: hypothetical protein A2Z20_08400 [Bdellovibrionales bacterium RBG_16_40_8]
MTSWFYKQFNILKTASLLAMVVLLAACDKSEPLQNLGLLSSPTGYAKLEANFCTNPPDPAQQKLKYLFILDHSSSNKPGFPIAPTDATNTDSDGSRRYGPMADFVRNLVPDPNNITSFALIDFNDDARQIGMLTGFESTQSIFLNTVITDWVGGGTQINPSPYDNGYTNYQDALNLAKQIITDDASDESSDPNNKIKSSYQIIFVSDGVPTIRSNDGGTYTQTFSSNISPVISDIMDLKIDPKLQDYISGITLNTAYYYDITPLDTARDLLQNMANSGNGRYLEFASGENILYQQFAPPSRMIRNQLVEVFIDNMSAVWWDDGRFYGDTDGDGLPDFIEMQVGSDSAIKDTDGNGVSDLVEFRAKGFPCDDTNCLPANRDLYAICDGYSPVVDSANRVTFQSTTNDGLNDCEKFLIHASRFNFTSSDNFIPDQLALRNTISLIPGTANSAKADPFADGVTNYDKLKLGLPIQISQRLMNFDFKTRHTNLVKTSSPSVDIDCYKLNVDHIAIVSNHDVLKLMIVQNGAVIEDKPILSIAGRSLNGSSIVKFSQRDFK